MYETILGVTMGLGLAAACGFRVFVPLLVLAIAHRAGAVNLGHGTAWIGSDAALVALATATLLEVVAYWVPWLDHVLDTAATPAAVVAGTLVAGSQMADLGPFMQWACALIAGGGVAAAVQASTVLTRATSTVTTAGLANPVIATVESAGAAVLSALAVVAPIVAGVVLVGLLGFVGWALLRWRRRRVALA
jgi:hypothetical protein